MRDDPYVVALVARAAQGDQRAWNEIVERYAPLVWSICARYRLGRHDAEDVGQTVWLLLVEQLGKLRQPAALPGWLATTTQRECLRVVTAARRSEHLGSKLEDTLQREDSSTIEQEVIAAERNAGLRVAFAALPPACRKLLSMLIGDPPRSYAEISAALAIPVGSIGPQRGRCLERLRKSETLIAFGDGEITVPGGEHG
jgi:RNA polymerase sigma factor (sigma-70 family)